MPIAMRDALIEEIASKMHSDEKIFFVSADFGSPALDRLRSDFEDRFINVGIAEQNLINVSAGLALEGLTVYSYAIAPFLTMRAYEQIRNNLAILSQIRPLNITLIGVGIGLSYDVTGPTHHCLEDLSVMRVLPNLSVISPCDAHMAQKAVAYTLNHKHPKYIRLDGKPLPDIYENKTDTIVDDCFCELLAGNDLCIVATGYMTHKALTIAAELNKMGISTGVIDIFLMKPVKEGGLFKTLSRYKNIATLEEGFIKKGGLDCLISDIIISNKAKMPFLRFGFDDSYVFEVGSRDYLHSLVKLDVGSVAESILKILYNR